MWKPLSGLLGAALPGGSRAWEGTWGRSVVFWVIVQGLFCSCLRAGSKREDGNYTSS